MTNIIIKSLYTQKEIYNILQIKYYKTVIYMIINFVQLFFIRKTYLIRRKLFIKTIINLIIKTIINLIIKILIKIYIEMFKKSIGKYFLVKSLKFY